MNSKAYSKPSFESSFALNLFSTDCMELLSRLDGPSLYHCLQVCKTWHNDLTNPVAVITATTTTSSSSSSYSYSSSSSGSSSSSSYHIQLYHKLLSWKHPILYKVLHTVLHDSELMFFLVLPLQQGVLDETVMLHRPTKSVLSCGSDCRSGSEDSGSGSSSASSTSTSPAELHRGWLWFDCGRAYPLMTEHEVVRTFLTWGYVEWCRTEHYVYFKRDPFLYFFNKVWYELWHKMHQHSTFVVYNRLAKQVTPKMAVLDWIGFDYGQCLYNEQFVLYMFQQHHHRLFHKTSHYFLFQRIDSFS